MKPIVPFLLLALVAPALAQATNPQADALVESANEAKKAGKLDVAISTLKTAISMDPKNEPGLISLGRAYGAKGDYVSAEKTFVDLLTKVNPKSAEGHRYLSLTYLRKGDKTKALEWAQKAIVLAPKDWESHHLMAEVHLSMANIEKGIEAEKAVLAIDKNNTDALRGLVVAYRAQKKFDLAIAEALKLAKAEPSDLGVQLQVAALYGEKGDRKKAKAALDAVEKKASGRPAALENVAAAYAMMGAGEDAFRLYKKLVEKVPESPTVRLALANLFLMKGQFDPAKTHAEKARDLVPKSGEPHRTLGLIFAAKEDLKGAEAAFRKAMALEPTRMETHLALGSVLAQANRIDEAIAEFEIVRKAAPAAKELLSPLCQLYRKKADKTKGKDVCLAACKDAGVKPEDCAVP